MAKNITFRLTVTLLVLISIFVKVQYAQAAKHKVNPFTPQYYCTSAYPTAYRVVDQFSLVETSTSGFTKNQTNKTIILTLPAGFEFNPAVVGDTVRYIPGRDITAISSPVVTATTITVTLSTKNAYTGYDALYFEGFEIRATAAGSGILARLSSNRGTFKVNGSTSTPAETESFGFLYSNTPMVLDSSKVVQDITVPISRNCRHSEILEIAMYVDNVCPAEITQFVFSTAGDPGYSENPAVNIEEAAVYCTDTSRGFVANNLVGTSLTPSGAFTINCSYFLNKGPGTYYFYLTYEVSALATVGEILDASLTSFTFDGAVIVDADDPNPTGTRTIDDNCDQPDMPNPQPNMTLIPAGSYIIPMDNTKQSETAAPFNVKAYGLIHQLLLNDMPVQWAIKSGKAKGDIDFSANVAKVYPAPAGAAIEDFWASAFIVDSAYVNHAVNPFVLSADEVVQAFGNSVAVYQLQEDVIVDIRYEIYQRPKIAVFNNGYDPGVLSVVFDAAEIDNYVEISAGVFPGLEECYTFCCEPHWDGADPETQEITDKVGEFVRTGGNFYAQCLGVETYEDHQLFQSTAGVDIDNTDVFHEYYNADLAYMQVDGEVQRNQAGSQEKWRLTNGSSWVNGFYYAISSDIDIEHIVASGTKVTNVDSVGGNVYYFGGHEYLSAASITKINAMRLMLNASLIPSGKPTQFDLFPGDEITICAGESTTLGGSPTGPPGATYQWDPSESLDIPTSANPVATPADTTEYQVLSKSGGCQVGPRSVIVNVAQPSVVTCAPDDEICFSDLSYAIGGSVTNAPGQLWTTSGDGTFDDDSQIFTNYNPGPTDKSSGTVTLTLSASGACNETSDDLILTILPLEDPTVSDDFTMRAGCVDSLIAYNYQEGTITWAAVPASVLYDSYLSCTAGCDTVLITAPAVFPAFIDYQVTGKPISGCPDAFTSDIVRVSFVNPLTAEITPEEPGVCSGDASTPLTANGHDGSAPYTFKWNTTSTLQTIPGSVEGWYWVDVSDNTQCGSARDSVWLTVFGSPISADAGADQDVCEDNPSVTLDGTIVEAGGGIWTGGDGIFTPDDTDPHADYTPSAGEITAGSVTLMLSATDTAGCDGDFSQMTINIFPVATVTAGIDATICADETFVCQGNFGGSTSEITWTTSGDGTFDDEHDKNAVYTPGNDDKTDGFANLTITSDDPVGPCDPVNASIRLDITPLDDGSFTYASAQYCISGVDPSPTVTGDPGGTFTEGTGNLSINAGTGLIDLSASTVGGPYTVTYTTAGACPVSETFDIEILPIDDATFSYTSNTFCLNDADPNATVTGDPGGTFSEPSGNVSLNAGTGTIDLSSSVVGGPYTITYTTAGPCVNTFDFDVTILEEEDPSFTYPLNTYCQGDIDPTPTVTGTGGGTFSAPIQVSINAASGVIDLSASTAGGPYAITYTTPGVCSNFTTFNITIVAEDDPSFTYTSNTFCQGDADPLPTITGTPGGTFSAPVQVSINAASGLIDLSASTVGGPYNISYLTGGVCPNSTTFAITIDAEENPAFTYAANEFCQNDADPSPTITGTGGGTFSEPTGDLSLNPGTGLIDLSASVVGNYVVTYTTPGVCSNSTTFNVEVMEEESPAFTYASNSYCQGDVDPSPTVTGVGGGTFTAPPQVSINAATGVIDLSASTVGGPYAITYTTPGTCSNFTTFNISIEAEESPAFTYPANSYCQGDADPSPTITGTGGGTFTEGTGNLSINAASGVIDLSASTVGGPYTITYTTPGTCSNSTTFNITVAAEEDPSFTYASNTYCQGDADPSPTVTGTGGGTFSAPVQVSINAASGIIDLSASTVGGPYVITYTTPGTCSNATTFNITIVVEDDPSFTYAANSYCQGDADPSPTITGTGGGTFTEGTGNVSINAGTGKIDLSASTVGGPYTITYTTPNACPNSTTFNVSIEAEEDPSFSYDDISYCQGDADPTPTIGGTGGGTFTAPPAVSINASTGVIDLSASAVGGPYIIRYTTPGTCSNFTSFIISIKAEDDPTFHYSAVSYCQADADPSAIIDGTAGGTFTEGSGDVTINAATGEIDLSASTVGGPYTITYTTAGVCPNSSTFNVTIKAEEDPSFTYTSNTYCQGAADPSPTITGTPGGTFSEGTGNLSINTNSGLIDLSASTVGGPYTVTYTTPGTCSNSTTFNITVVAEDDPSFNYAANNYCPTGADPSAVITGTGGGTFTSVPAVIFLDAGTGEIDLSASTVGGPYSITYTTAGACPNSSNFNLSITAEDDPSFTYSAISFCQGDADPVATITGTGGGTFTGPVAVVFTDAATGEIDLEASTVGGPYTITYTTPNFCPNSTTFDISIVAEDDPSFTYTSGSYCQTGIDPVATITGTGGGTFSGPVEVVFLDAGTGEIDLSASTLGGPYVVTYTTTGTCPNSDSFDLSITDSPDAGFDYTGPYCQKGANPLPTFDPGASAGTFSATPAGLNFVNVNTGRINLTTSTPGVYKVYNTIAPSGGCAQAKDSAMVTINPIDDPSFSYTAASFCQGDADPVATITGAGGGSFSVVAQLTLLDAGTGEIDLSASTLGGPYSVTYTTVGICPNSTNHSISILAEEDPSFTYASNNFCQADADPPATITGTGGGTFTEASGNVSINAATGLIDLSASIAGGPYTITYTTPGTCSNNTTFDVTIEAEESPAFTYASNTYCQGGVDPTPTITGTGGGTFSAPIQLVIDGGTGEIDLSGCTPGGPYTVTYTTPGTCSNSTTFNITIILDDPTFHYSANSYCQGDADPSATIDGTPGGTFSEVSGNVSLNASNGLIDLSASTAGGPYTIRYSTGGMCPIGSTWDVTIVTEDDPAFTYGSNNYCQGDADPTATITGTGGGTFSAVPAVVFLDVNTGEIDVSASTIGGPYVITYTTPGVCPNSTTFNVSITGEGDPSFTYAANSFCQGDADPSATITGTTGGTFTEGSGDISLNASTGAIDLSASTVGGPYTITYTTGGFCSNSTTFDVSIMAEENPAFTYSSNKFCQGGSDPAATITGTGGGTFSAVPAVVFLDVNTGEIDVSASTAGGPYVITYTTPGTCSNATTFNLTVYAEDDASFTYTANSFCQGDADPSPTITGTGGGTFTEAGGNLSINATTGEIDLSASTAGGPYSVKYVTPGQCKDSTTWFITINAEDDPSFNYSAASYCQTGIDPVAIITGTAGGGFTEGTGTLVLDAGTGEIDLSASPLGNFIVTYTTVGICPNSQTAAVSITDGPQASFSYAQPFCQQDADPVAILDMGSQAGTFTANSGAVVFLDVNTGEIDMTATAAGTHRIYNNIAAAGGCAATKDSADITVYPIPTVSAGSDDAFCHYDTYELDGSFGGGASSIIWSVTTGGGFDNATLPGAIYTPSQIDIDNDSVVVTIITDDPVGPCVAVTDFVVLTIPAEITVDTDGDQTVCANNAVTTLNGTVSGATNTGYWSTSGTGTFAPDSTALGGTYTPSDADTAAGFVILTLHSTNNGICAEVTGTMTLTFTDGPVVYAGADDEVCANNGSYTLSGAIEGGASEGIWTTSGTGSFQPNDIDLGATYIPSDIDTAAGSVVITLTTTDHGSCNEEDHSFTLTITDAPYVSAGVDQTICADGATVTLAGVITAGSTEGYWETSGDGTFTPDSTDLLAVYTPGTNDVSAGSVTLVITSTNNDLCVAETDTMEITITTGIVVDAGIDQEVCGHDPDIELDGAVSGGTTTGEWSTSGTGDFDPDEFALDAIYRPSDADTAAGIITLVLTSTNNGLCVEVTDTLILTINDAAIVSAGSDVTVCASNADVDITADVHGSTSTGIWETSGTGTFSPHDSALTVTYIPSDADTAAGLVYLTLTTTHLENCTAVIDTVEVNITPVPLVDAGEDIFVCANMADATLDGHVAGASTTGVWTTLGTGIFSPHDSLLTATYEASTPDTTAGSVTLILTSTHNGGCLEVTDTVDIFFTEAPLANANIDQTVCANTQLQLAGSVAFGAGTGEWTTNGTGTFSPDSTDLNAVYTFSNADTAAGALTFILSTTNAAGCAPHSDTMEVTITDAPYVEAGPDVSVCENNDTVTLSGAVWGATTTGEWSTTGTGNFFADEFTLNGQYVPSDDDTLIRVFPIFLTSTVNGDCNAVTDSFELTITTMPYADAGEDLPICKGLEANLNGQIFGGSGEGTWTSSGTGTFAPNADALDAVYTPSDADTTAGLVYLYLESTDNGNCLPAYDTIAISLTELPNITAGVDQTVCANKDTVQLAGIISGATTTGFWTTEGDGEFVPADTVLDAEYIPGLEDLANGAVTLTLTATNACFAQDSMEITITPAPVVDAGADQIVCIDVSTVHLTGSITGGATAGEWTTSGTGSFIPNAQTPNADYLRSSADSALGHVTLILTTTDHGDCYPDADTMEVSMTDIPVVFAGVDKTYCSNNANITLNGSVTGQSSTGHWVSSGTGTFTPNANTLNATYKPSSADTAAHTVTLTLSSTNTCVIVSDAVTFTLTPAPLVSAGGDYTSCSNNPTLTLDGAVDAGAHTGKWYTTGTGTFLPTNTTLGATYSPTPADIASGTVYLTLISTVNGMCYPVRDTAVLTIQQAPIVDAGDDMYICTYENAELEGSVTGITTSGTWQTSGTGSFSPDPDTLDAEYVPSVADIAAGNLILTLTSTNNDACIAVSQGINLVITAKPTVTAGDDETVCANNAEISLSGSVSGSGTTGIWTSSGTGTFTPDATNLNAHYIPSDEDTATGNVQLILSSTYACLNSDTLEMVMTPAPQVFAGADQYFCEEQLIIDLSADIFGGSTTGIWTTSGSGTFSPNDSALILDYLPSSADTASERIYLYLTSTHNGDCNAVVDSLSVNFIEPPEIDAGPDQTVCANTFVVVNGHTSGSEDLPVEWFTSGDGEFNPDNEQLLVSYHFGDEDVGSDTVQLSLATPYFIGCDPRADTMNVFLTTPPIIYAGEDQSICSARDTALVIGQIWGITSTGVWTSDGDGSFINPATSLNNGYIPGPTDGDSGIVLLILTTTGNGVCLPEKDTVVVTLTKPAEVYAGPDMYICYGSNVRLEGEVSGLSTTGIWSADGGGSFSPNPTILDGSYVPIDSDTLIGTLTLILASTDNGVCTATLDTMLATITQLPFVDAGSDEDVCANDAVITLNGIVSGVTTTGEWNSTGSGTFSPDSVTLNGSYIPSDEDTAAGTIYLFLESTNACRVVDSLIVNISKAPVVNAGPDLYICGDDSTAELSGYVGVATTTGIWTTDGTGYFLPDETTLNAVYVRSSDDSLAQVVTLVLTSTVNGDCLAETDTTVIHITTVPVVDAGGDQTICANNDLMLTGSVTVGSTTGIWLTSGNGTFSPSATDLNAQYLMSMDDTANGGVTLILKSTFACVDVYDTVDVIITPAPFITATLDGQICDNDPVLQLHGSVGIATGLEWSTLGDGSFSPNELSTDPQYLAGYDDIDFGMFTIVLASTGNGLCNPVYDTLELNMVRAPEVIAGPDQILCFDVLGVSLSGQVTGSSVSGKWTASGAGHFFPSDSSLNTMYVPTVGDVAFGSVKFYLQSTHNGSCIAVMDSLTAYWENEPVVDAGDDQRVCSNTTGIQLDGNVIGVSSTGIWSSAGNGSFSPSDSAFDAVYVPSTAERAQNSIKLILTSTHSCTPIRDTVEIFFNRAPVAQFTTSNTCNNLTVNFTNTSSITTGAITGYSWNFGDSNSSTDEDPTHDYAALGDYQVSLTATSDSGCVKVITKTVPLSTIATDFAFASNCFLDAGVAFTDLTQIVNDSIVSWKWIMGDGGQEIVQNPTHEYDDPGVYSVQLIATTENGCIDTMLYQVPVVETQTDFAYTVNCLTDSVYFTDLSSATNDSIIGYTWSFGDGGTDTIQNPQYNYASGTTFTVTLITETSQGCIDSISQPIALSNVVADFEYSGICMNEGAVTFTDITTAENDSVVVWDWSFGDGNISSEQNPENEFAVSDTFTVQLAVQTQNNCRDTISKSIVLVDLDINFDYIAGCWSDSVQFVNTSTVSNDVFVQWKWWLGDGNTHEIENPLYEYTDGGNEYEVTLVGHTFKGCVDTIVQIIQLTSIHANFDYSGTCFYNTGVTLTDQSYVNSDSIVGWSWNFGDGDTDTLQNTFHTYDTLGLYDVELILLSDSGCTDTVIQTIAISEVNALFGVVSECMSSSGMVFTDSSDASFSTIEEWAWSFGDGGIDSVQNPVHIFDTSGVFDVELIITSNAGCTDTLSRSIAVSRVIADYTYTGNCVASGGVSFSDNSLAENSQISEWHWDFGDGDTDTIANPVHEFDTTGNFAVQLIVVSDMGCTDTITRNIPVSTVIANFGFDENCLNSGGVEFSDSSIAVQDTIIAWSWSFGDGMTDTVQNPVHEYDTAGDYTVQLIVTGQNGCTDTLEAIVPVYGVTSDFTYLTNCSSNDVQFSDLSTADNDSIISWSWDFGDGTSDNTQNPQHLFDTSGNYTVVLTVQTANGCSDAASLSIAVSVFNADFSYSGICNGGDNVVFTDASVIENDTIISWAWNFGDGSTANVQNPVHDYSTEMDYTVTLIIGTSGGCSDTVMQIVPVVSVDADFSYSGLCITDSVYFTDNSTVVNDVITDWTWDFDPGTDSVQNPTTLFGSAGNRDVTLIIETQHGCIDSVDVTVALSSVAAGFTHMGVCAGETITFIDTSKALNDAITDRQWDLGDGTTDTTTNVTHVYASEGSFTVDLVVTGTSGCSDSASQNIVIRPNPVAAFTWTPEIPRLMEPIFFTDLSVGATSWYWDFGNLKGNSSEQNPAYAYDEITSFTVILTITNDYGCEDTATMLMVVGGAYPPSVPTGFSPNGDGINSLLFVKGGPFSEFDFKIYNEWGKRVFETTDPSDGWDGTVNGKEQPVGVYVYSLYVVTSSGETFNLVGDITLLR